MGLHDIYQKVKKFKRERDDEFSQTRDFDPVNFSVVLFSKLSACIADCNDVTPLQQSTKAPLYTHQVTMLLSSDEEALTVGNKLRKEMDPSVSSVR